MTPVPPNVVLSALGKTGGALQKQQQLAGFRDRLLIDAIATASADAELAAKAIVDEAEAILSDATVCRWDDADDVHALRVRITHYLEDRPRLTSLTDALDQLPTLLEELHRRAKRKLQTPAKKTKKQAPLAAAIDALASLRDFVEELPAETMHLPAGTGVAAEEQVFLLDLTQQEAPETHQPCRSGRGRDCIGQGGGEAVADTARFQRRPAGVGRRPHRLRLIAGFKPRLPIGAGPPHERHTRAHLL
jgi:hypothetical protein